MLLYDVANMYFSVGVITALTFGIIILLRPVTNPLLEPRDRVRLWSFGWYCSYTAYIWCLYGRVKVLPWSFRGLLRLRLEEPSQTPAILPAPGRRGHRTPWLCPVGCAFPARCPRGR